MLRIEFGLILLALVIAWLRPTLGSLWFERVENAFSRLARRQTLSVVLVGVSALALRAAFLPLLPIPKPIVHDEFGYLLAADTFTHGRLTNPTHPMWVHFESFNILQRPTYQCITPPAQGLVLAAGKVLLGHPFLGVLLSAAAMCTAITWMLQAWVSLEWALLGGVLAIVRYAVLTYWADSYWGGAVGAIGGALVLGALPRIMRDYQIRDSLLLAFGLAILANNRPFDGFVLSAPVMLVLLTWMWRRDSPSFRVIARQVAFPLVASLFLAGSGTAYYFSRVTGNPLRMPYAVERETYAVAPYLVWQPLRPEPIYHHTVIRDMYIGEEMLGYQIGHSIAGPLMKAYYAWRFYIGPLLSVPLVSLLFLLPYGFSWKEVDSKTRFLLITFCFVALGCAVETFYAGPHYSSPATGLVLALVVLAFRILRHSGARGVFLVRAVVTSALVIFLLRAFAVPLRIPLNNGFTTGLYEQRPKDFGRTEMQKQLEQLPGKQLVVVRYAPKHEPFEEWVYNDADIDHSKVVWAREMDAAENRRLINYFHDRTAWLLEADGNPRILLPYPNIEHVSAATIATQPVASRGEQ